MKKYVLGIATPDDDSYVMIKKNRPEWQAGLLNFPGGKIETWEDHPEFTMAREFEEETGVHTEANEWRQIGKMYRTDDFEVYVYYMKSEIFKDAKTVEDEEIELIDYESLSEHKQLMPNIMYLLEFVRSSDFDKYGTYFTISYGGPPSHFGKNEKMDV